MKRKKPNITTASLRSASSSKRSRRVTSTKNHLQITNTSNSYYSFALGGRTNNANKSIEKTPVGSASKKAYFCHGCNKEFRLYSSVQMFINKHVNGNKKCLKVYPKCICGKIFYDKKNSMLIKVENLKIVIVSKNSLVRELIQNLILLK